MGAKCSDTYSVKWRIRVNLRKVPLSFKAQEGIRVQITVMAVYLYKNNYITLNFVLLSIDEAQALAVLRFVDLDLASIVIIVHVVGIVVIQWNIHFFPTVILATHALVASRNETCSVVMVSRKTSMPVFLEWHECSDEFLIKSFSSFITYESLVLPLVDNAMMLCYFHTCNSGNRFLSDKQADNPPYFVFEYI